MSGIKYNRVRVKVCYTLSKRLDGLLFTKLIDTISKALKSCGASLVSSRVSNETYLTLIIEYNPAISIDSLIILIQSEVLRWCGYNFYVDYILEGFTDRLIESYNDPPILPDGKVKQVIRVLFFPFLLLLIAVLKSYGIL